MKKDSDYKQLTGLARVAATTGMFDGVHLGHQFLLKQLLEVANERSMPPLIITFNRHPMKVINPSAQVALLTTEEEKMEALRAFSQIETHVLDFDEMLRKKSACEFLRMIHDDLKVGTLLMGYDHRFGSDGGTPEQYQEWGREIGIEVIQAKPLPQQKVSSSRIRCALLEGRIREANMLLTRPYSLKGVVVHGKALGRKLGFPTANIIPQADKLIPACGVYAVCVTLPSGISKEGMMCIGKRPTVNDGSEVTIEVHLFDCEENLYDQQLIIHFCDFLREEMCFPSLKDLQNQLAQDKVEALRRLN